MTEDKRNALVAVGLAGAIIIGGLFLMAEVAPPMPDRSSYKPYTTAHADMSMKNRLGDQRFLCSNADCDSGTPFKGTKTGLIYANAEAAIFGQPMVRETPTVKECAKE